MFQAYFLRLHRWISLVFALPLLVVIFTGLVLSFQPMVQSLSIRPGSLSLERLETLIAQHDPAGRARALTIDAYANSLRLQGAAGAVDIDLTTGAKIETGSSLRAVFSWARRTHERLISGFGFVVVGSTIAMLVIMTLGVLMGLPRLRNSLSGWHKGIAWGLLPLLALSPLTGLFLSFGITLSEAPPARAQPVPLLEAVRLVGARHELSRVAGIGPRGGRMLAILDEGGSQRAFMVSAQGLRETPRNWSRALHEGTWSAVIAGILNIVVSVALLGLLGTGLTIWARRTLRPRRRRGDRPGAAIPSSSRQEAA